MAAGGTATIHWPGETTSVRLAGNTTLEFLKGSGGKTLALHSGAVQASNEPRSGRGRQPLPDLAEGFQVGTLEHRQRVHLLTG